MNIFQKIKRWLNRSDVELRARPLMAVQRPTNPDDSVMLHTGVKDTYMPEGESGEVSKSI